MEGECSWYGEGAADGGGDSGPALDVALDKGARTGIKDAVDHRGGSDGAIDERTVGMTLLRAEGGFMTTVSNESVRTGKAGPTSPRIRATSISRERAFSRATLRAPRSQSIPATMAASRSLAPQARMPVPHPRSSTRCPSIAPSPAA